jgi:seryl-tRNA synthetase
MSAIQKNPDGSATGAAAARQKPSPAENERTGLPTEAGNVDKIREILFGGQMRDYDKRFSRLEERLMKESNELRENTRRSIETLESFVKKEFEALSAQLDAERQGRDGVAREFHDTASTIQKKLEDFENHTAQAQRDLRQQLLDQSKSLNDEIRRKHDEISTALQREVADLNDEKTDRLALAALFTEVALRLNQDFKIPGDNEA